MSVYCLFRDNLDILMDTFYKEIEKLSDHALQVRIWWKKIVRKRFFDGHISRQID